MNEQPAVQTQESHIDIIKRYKKTLLAAGVLTIVVITFFVLRVLIREPSAEVNYTQNKFLPETLTVLMKDDPIVILLKNTGNEPIELQQTSPSNPIKITGALNAGGSQKIEFREAGRFEYQNRANPDQKGVIELITIPER